MRFWDTSAIVPLLITEPTSQYLLALLQDDDGMAVWWAASVECMSSLTRRLRDGELDTEGVSNARALLDVLRVRWVEIEPASTLRSSAEKSLITHPLRAADASQLSAALVWSESSPKGRVFVCLDRRLREAATREGFTLEPTS